jgi:hypothetical protein
MILYSYWMYIHLHAVVRELETFRKELSMRTAIFLSVALAGFGLLLVNLPRAPAYADPGKHGQADSHQPELEYLKAVNSVAPPRDPQLLFLLMGQYSNANLHGVQR